MFFLNTEIGGISALAMLAGLFSPPMLAGEATAWNNLNSSGSRAGEDTTEPCLR